MHKAALIASKGFLDNDLTETEYKRSMAFMLEKSSGEELKALARAILNTTK
jgi:hypothetical protein